MFSSLKEQMPVQAVEDSVNCSGGPAFAAAWNAALQEALADTALLASLRLLLDRGGASTYAAIRTDTFLVVCNPRV